MQRVLISYDLLEPRHTKANRKELYAELQSLGAVQIQGSVWVASTEMSVTYLTAKLRAYFGPTDLFLVASIDEIKSRQGLNKIPRL